MQSQVSDLTPRVFSFDADFRCSEERYSLGYGTAGQISAFPALLGTVPSPPVSLPTYDGVDKISLEGFDLNGVSFARRVVRPLWLICSPRTIGENIFVGGLLPILRSNRLHVQFSRQIETKPRGYDINDYPTRSHSLVKFGLSRSVVSRANRFPLSDQSK